MQGFSKPALGFESIAIEATTAVREWAREGKIELELRPYRSSDLEGVFLAVVATSSRTLNERIYGEAQARRVLCNVVDVPDLCDFFYPSVVRRGDLQIAVSTAGQSPVAGTENPATTREAIWTCICRMGRRTWRNQES